MQKFIHRQIVIQTKFEITKLSQSIFNFFILFLNSYLTNIFGVREIVFIGSIIWHNQHKSGYFSLPIDSIIVFFTYAAFLVLKQTRFENKIIVYKDTKQNFFSYKIDFIVTDTFD